MPKLPSEPLHRTNINLYASDVEKLKHQHGFGWSEVVRELVRQHMKQKLREEDEDD